MHAIVVEAEVLAQIVLTKKFNIILLKGKNYMDAMLEKKVLFSFNRIYMRQTIIFSTKSFSVCTKLITKKEKKDIWKYEFGNIVKIVEAFSVDEGFSSLLYIYIQNILNTIHLLMICINKTMIFLRGKQNMLSYTNLCIFIIIKYKKKYWSNCNI